jgi:hypothetical protein
MTYSFLDRSLRHFGDPLLMGTQVITGLTRVFRYVPIFFGPGTVFVIAITLGRGTIAPSGHKLDGWETLLPSPGC